MKALTSKGWVHWIKSVWLDRQRPLLGICLGMQMLATYGYEGSSNGSPVSGLDLVPGHVDLLELPSGYLLPHVGWNSLCFTNTSHPLAQCLNEASDMYFVHSFVFNTRHPQHSIATTDYGSEFSFYCECWLLFRCTISSREKSEVWQTNHQIFSCHKLMLKKRLIPKLQISLRNSFRGPQPLLVVTNQFSKYRPVGDPLSQAKIYEAQLADELILLNLNRSDEIWPIFLQILKKLVTPL